MCIYMYEHSILSYLLFYFWFCLFSIFIFAFYNNTETHNLLDFFLFLVFVFVIVVKPPLVKKHWSKLTQWTFMQLLRFSLCHCEKIDIPFHVLIQVMSALALTKPFQTKFVTELCFQWVQPEYMIANRYVDPLK